MAVLFILLGSAAFIVVCASISLFGVGFFDNTPHHLIICKTCTGAGCVACSELGTQRVNDGPVEIGSMPFPWPWRKEYRPSRRQAD